MNTLSIEGWCKPEGASKSTRIESLHFRVSEAAHLEMENAEEKLRESDTTEVFVTPDMAGLELETSADCGELTDCKFRVYLNADDQTSNFHLVAKRVSDGALIYSDAVLVEFIG